MNTRNTNTKQTAAEAYAQHSARVAQQVAELQAKLAAHAKRAAAEPWNWCLAGDLERMVANLDEALGVRG